MNRMETALTFHDRGFNCCQSVLAGFADRLGIPEETALRLGAGFGSGAGTGELCGALTGAIMALDLMFPADLDNPVASKKQAVQRAKRLQQRFSERFGALRCRDLLRAEKEDPPETVASLRLGNHCAVMIATAVELTQEMLDEEKAG